MKCNGAENVLSQGCFYTMKISYEHILLQDYFKRWIYLRLLTNDECVQQRIVFEQWKLFKDCFQAKAGYINQCNFKADSDFDLRFCRMNTTSVVLIYAPWSRDRRAVGWRSFVIHDKGGAWWNRCPWAEQNLKSIAAVMQAYAEIVLTPETIMELCQVAKQRLKGSLK